MKLVRILRGLPGTGKSRLAKKMAQEEGAVVFNNDDLLTEHGVYKWDEDRVLLAHYANQYFAAEAMRNSALLLVVDNTNLLPYHCSPYVRLAKYYGYDYRIIRVETPWALDVAELERRNTHEVPASVIEEMKKTLLGLPIEALGAILFCENAMDPEMTLRTAQMFIEQGRFVQADEQMMDYEDWRRIGGYEPEAGDEVATSITEKLQDWRSSCMS